MQKKRKAAKRARLAKITKEVLKRKVTLIGEIL